MSTRWLSIAAAGGKAGQAPDIKGCRAGGPHGGGRTGVQGGAPGGYLATAGAGATCNPPTLSIRDADTR